MSVAAISSERIESDDNVWTRRLVLFLRIMAVISVAKGLYHWAQVTGFVGGEEEAFENQPMAWQTATVYFAVIELVAAVGLWLATPWGAVVWLTTVVSMAVIELMFPGIYGGSLTIVGVDARDARGLSRAGLDGGARTAAVAWCVVILRSIAQRCVSKDAPRYARPMVRDGASAPPHHEAVVLKRRGSSQYIQTSSRGARLEGWPHRNRRFPRKSDHHP